MKRLISLLAVIVLLTVAGSQAQAEPFRYSPGGIWPKEFMSWYNSQDLPVVKTTKVSGPCLPPGENFHQYIEGKTWDRYRYLVCEKFRVTPKRTTCVSHKLVIWGKALDQFNLNLGACLHQVILVQPCGRTVIKDLPYGMMKQGRLTIDLGRGEPIIPAKVIIIRPGPSLSAPIGKEDVLTYTPAPPVVPGPSFLN